MSWFVVLAFECCSSYFSMPETHRSTSKNFKNGLFPSGGPIHIVLVFISLIVLVCFFFSTWCIFVIQCSLKIYIYFVWGDQAWRWFYMLEDCPGSLLFWFFFLKWAFVREVNVLCKHVCCIVLFPPPVLLKSVSVRLIITNLHETSRQILEVTFCRCFLFRFSPCQLIVHSRDRYANWLIVSDLILFFFPPILKVLLPVHNPICKYSPEKQEKTMYDMPWLLCSVFSFYKSYKNINLLCCSVRYSFQWIIYYIQNLQKASVFTWIWIFFFLFLIVSDRQHLLMFCVQLIHLLGKNNMIIQVLHDWKSKSFVRKSKQH